MSTSVKLSVEDKEKLEKLQALVTLKAGAKVTQQELLARLVKDALARGDEFVETAFKPHIPMSDREYQKLLALIEDWGAETRWEELDRRLYGTGSGRRLSPHGERLHRH